MKKAIYTKFLTPSTLGALAYGLFSIILSIALFGYYDGGDQKHYHAYWDVVPELSFFEAYTRSKLMLGSAEPGYTLMSFIFAGIIDKDILISLLNGLLGFYLAKWMIRKKVSLLVISLTLSNYYLLVLFFAAERLKLSLLFILIAENYRVTSMVWYLAAMLSHVSSALLLLIKYSNTVLGNFYRILLTGAVTKKNVLLFCLGTMIIASITIILYEHILSKLEFSGVGDKFSIVAVIKIMVFVAFSIIYSKKRLEPLIASIPLFLFGAMLGPERITMFAFLMFMYYGLQHRRGVNVGVIVASVYFMLKGVIFVDTFITYGNGFYFDSYNDGGM